MKSEEEKILSMIEEGAISAEEGQVLLDAIEESSDEWQPTATGDAPDMDYYREHWQKPFGVALIATGISGSLLLRTKNAGLLGRIFRLLFLWPVTIIGGLLTVLFYLSKDAPWLHVRVKPEDGPKINISIPLPLQLAQKGLEVARPYASTPESEEQLMAVSEFLQAVGEEGISDPMTIDVEDEGAQVQVYIG